MPVAERNRDAPDVFMLKNHDFVAGSIVTMFGLAMLYHAQTQLPSRVGLYPSFVTGLMCVLGLALIGRSLTRAGRSRGFGPYVVHLPKFVISVVLTGLYFIASGTLGFMESTLVYIPMIAWLSGYRHIGAIAGGTVIYVVVLYLVFDLSFQRPLPEGVVKGSIESLFANGSDP